MNNPEASYGVSRSKKPEFKGNVGSITVSTGTGGYDDPPYNPA